MIKFETDCPMDDIIETAEDGIGILDGMTNNDRPIDQEAVRFLSFLVAQYKQYHKTLVS